LTLTRFALFVLAVVAVSAALNSIRPFESRWALVQTVNGNDYIQDHGLTLGDCYDAMNRRPSGWSCHRQN